MKEPGPWIVGHKANGHLVSRGGTNVDDITPDRIDPVVSTVASTAHNKERVLLVLSTLGTDLIYNGQSTHTPWR